MQPQRRKDAKGNAKEGKDKGRDFFTEAAERGEVAEKDTMHSFCFQTSQSRSSSVHSAFSAPSVKCFLASVFLGVPPSRLCASAVAFPPFSAESLPISRTPPQRRPMSGLMHELWRGANRAAV